MDGTPFLTQMRSKWFRNMKLSNRYPGRLWQHKALNALYDAAAPGEELTAFELVQRVAGFVGTCEDRNNRLDFTRRGCKLGMLEKTGDKRMNEQGGRNYPAPVYRVVRRKEPLPTYMRE